MAEPADFSSGAELNDTAVEAQAGPSPRNAEEWLDSDEAVGATQLPTILTLPTANGLSTQCPTDSVNESLLLVTTDTLCDDDDGNDSTPAVDVRNNPLLANDATVQLLLKVDDIIELAGYAAITANNHMYMSIQDQLYTRQIHNFTERNHLHDRSDIT